MAQVPARLHVELHSNGTVRMVFIVSGVGGNETSFTANNLETAEIYFICKCGLTLVCANALMAELKHNKIAHVETIIEETVAEKVRYAKP